MKTVAIDLARELSISGLVLDPEGKPIDEIGVSCRGRDGRLSQFGCGDWSERDGSFWLGPLLAGNYLVSARPNDPLHAISEMVPARSGASDVVVRLRWGGVLAGTVVDAVTGEEAPAVVMGAGRTSFSPSAGFEFEWMLPGSYDLLARTEDGRIGVLSGVRVHERQRDEGLVIQVRRGARLTVHTQALEGVFFRTEVDWGGTRIASEWGDLEAASVPPGQLVIRWILVDRKGGEQLEHEEVRQIPPAGELLVEHVIP